MQWKCTKCGQVVTSPPLNNQCPEGGSHSWVNSRSVRRFLAFFKKSTF